MCDQGSTLVSGGIGSAFTVGVLFFVRLVVLAFNTINHKRVRSNCCGTLCVTSLDVEQTTPTASNAPRVSPVADTPAADPDTTSQRAVRSDTGSGAVPPPRINPTPVREREPRLSDVIQCLSQT
jgi:hypothetical protein